jgi:hypothetical protein
MMARNKYFNKPATVFGITFDSKAEADRYMYLLSEQKKGNISELAIQVPYILQEGFVNYNGKKIREIKYIVDFEYRMPDGRIVVEDVKGFATKDFNLKYKMFMWRYRGIEIKIIGR